MAGMLRRIVEAIGRGSHAGCPSRDGARPGAKRANVTHEEGADGPAGEAVGNQASSQQPAPTQVEMQELEVPIQLFGGLSAMPLVDAIEALLFTIDQKENPCGLERYAARLFREVDLEALRMASLKTSLDVARIERTESFYLNFDRTDLTAHELATVLAAEASMNRILNVLTRLDMGFGPVCQSPSEEDCSRLDALAWHEVTAQVADIMKTATRPNRWACRDTVSCKPGGEWDVRTRFADIAERIKLPVRLDYIFNVNAAAGEMWARFASPMLESIPRSVYDARAGAWKTLDDQERWAFLGELQARMALVLAAACFASGLFIERCRITVDMPSDEEKRYGNPGCFAFERAEFMALSPKLVRKLDGRTYQGQPCYQEIARITVPHLAKDTRWAEFDETRAQPPAKDGRAFEEPLRSMLLADSASELEVMEDAQEPHMQRVRELRELAKIDPDSAARGYAELVEELEAACVLCELNAASPVESQFCEGYMARLLLPLTVEDKSLRILSVPDALYFAQDELCDMYTETGDAETALREARKLYDMAKSSSHAHTALICALANLERFDEVIEVAKHGLRIVSDRSSIAYLFYRMAFAFWQTGALETALACYRMVPVGESPWPVAQEEMKVLMAEMGRTEVPEFRWALNTIAAGGIELPPSKRITDFVFELAVQLVDAGFFFLGARCVQQLRSFEPNDELGVVTRSLQN